jgi:hypothetical protein
MPNPPALETFRTRVVVLCRAEIGTSSRSGNPSRDPGPGGLPGQQRR